MERETLARLRSLSITTARGAGGGATRWSRGPAHAGSAGCLLPEWAADRLPSLTLFRDFVLKKGYFPTGILKTVVTTHTQPSRSRRPRLAPCMSDRRRGPWLPPAIPALVLLQIRRYSHTGDIFLLLLFQGLFVQ